MTTIIVAIVVALIVGLGTNYLNKKQFKDILQTKESEANLKNYTTFKDAWDRGRIFGAQQQEDVLMQMTRAINR